MRGCLGSDEMRQKTFNALFAYTALSIFSWFSTPLFDAFIIPLIGFSEWNAYIFRFAILAAFTQVIGLMPILLFLMRSNYLRFDNVKSKNEKK